MYLIALAAEGLARWDGADRDKTSHVGWFVEEAQSYEGKPGMEDGATDLHRQVDSEDFVFAERRSLVDTGSCCVTWEESPRGCSLELCAISIHGLNRQARDEIESLSLSSIP